MYLWNLITTEYWMLKLKSLSNETLAHRSERSVKVGGKYQAKQWSSPQSPAGSPQQLRTSRVPLPLRLEVAKAKTCLSGCLKAEVGESSISQIVKRLQRNKRPKTLGAHWAAFAPQVGGFKQTKKSWYKIMQTMYKKNRVHVTRWILYGEERSTCQLDPKLVQRV